MKILSVLGCCMMLAAPVTAQEKEKKEYDCSHVKKLAKKWYDIQPNKNAMKLKGMKCLSTNAVKVFLFVEKAPSKVYDDRTGEVKKHVISDIEADVVCWPEYNPRSLNVTCFVDEIRVIKVHSVIPKEDK